MKKALYEERYLMVLDRYENEPRTKEAILNLARFQVLESAGIYPPDVVKKLKGALLALLTKKEWDLVCCDDYRKLEDPWANAHLPS